MSVVNSAPAEQASDRKQYPLWLPPLLAFAGLAFLFALGRPSWYYTLPYSQTNAQVLWIKTSEFQGLVQIPKNVSLNTALGVGGWLGSTDPSIHAQIIVLYLDGRPIAQTSSFYPALINFGEGNRAMDRWQTQVFLTDIPPGNHLLALLAVVPEHKPVILTQGTILVRR